MSETLYKLDNHDRKIDLHLSGRWTLSNLGAVEAKLHKSFKAELQNTAQDVEINFYGENIEIVDTSAILILKKLQLLVQNHNAQTQVNYIDFPEEFDSLNARLAEFDVENIEIVKTNEPSILNGIASFGEACVSAAKSFAEIPQLFGLFIFGLLEIIRHPLDFKFGSMMFHLQKMTVPAVAIVFAVSFMVGAVLTEQAAVRLPGFGTETLVVAFIGMVTARETSILLTGMLVAGRTSSAITAEIGSMRMNEEIDAMKVIGLDVMKFLVMPRAIAMLIALPILTFIAIIAGFAGSAVLLNIRYEMGFEEFIGLIYDGVTVYDIGTSMIKTPFIGIAMVLVACSEGLKVRSNAASLGHHTTISVVKSLFLVIIIDSVIAIYFTQLNRLEG